MHVSLTPELERIVQEKVKSGFYSNTSEVIRDAIRHLHEREMTPGRLRQAIQEGLDDLHAGRTVRYDMASIKRVADADEKSGKPISDDVQP